MDQSRCTGLFLLSAISTLPGLATGQVLTPQQVNEIRDGIGDRIEATTILGGDFGFSGGAFKSSGTFTANERIVSDISLSKFGGAGDIGSPQPIGSSGVGWQPRLQGSMGRIETTDHYQASLLGGDVSKFNGYGIEFGGGARFWLSPALSMAPTFMGLYGHMSNSYTANSTFAQENLGAAKQAGLIDWSVDTWTIRPALNIQYLINWRRTIFTLSSDSTYYHTESFDSSNPYVVVSGDSGTQAEKIDVDVPVRVQLFGHEVRTGGYVARTDLFGGLSRGLNLDHVYEAHGRVVLDFLSQLWVVQWIGLGGSYIWGGSLTGWTAGLDVAFVF